MEPDRIIHDEKPQAPLMDRLRNRGHRAIKGLTTRDGLIGDYDYAFLFKPRLPFMKKPRRAAPFFGLNDRMPVLLALLLGFQHSLAMLAGLISKW